MKKKSFICAFAGLMLVVLLIIVTLFVQNRSNNDNLVLTTKMLASKSQGETTTIDEIFTSKISHLTD